MEEKYKTPSSKKHRRSSKYEESKDNKYKYRDSHNYDNYYKHDSKYKGSSGTKERKRDKKEYYKSTHDEFKEPSKYQETSSERRAHQHYKENQYYSSKYEKSIKSSTYKEQSNKTNRSKDEEHYTFEVGDIIENRYKIIKHLGDGTFGRVYEVASINSGVHYACKIIRAVSRYVKSAKIEAKILCDIKDKVKRVVRVKNFFKFQKTSRHPEQYCLIFEKLGKSLYQYLEENEFRGFHISVIQDFTRQILGCLKDLKEKAKLIHTDLKPENILLVKDRSGLLDKLEYLPLQVIDKNKNVKWHVRKDGTISYSYSSRESEKLLNNPYHIPLSGDIKIIDLGSATYEYENGTGIINTRQYRGPEVMLANQRWDHKSDMWSLGGILAELYTGNQLFPTHDTSEHLEMIMKIGGRIPYYMYENTKSEVRKILNSIPKYGREYRERQKKMEMKDFKLIEDLILPEHREFGDFLKALITIDPKLRLSAKEALEHEFGKVKYVPEFLEFKLNYESKSTKNSSSVQRDKYDL